MANAREIKNRIKAVGNIKRITKTMQMIATSKFAKSLTVATAAKPFTEGVYELVRELAAKAGNVSHPLIDGPSGGAKGKHVLLVLTSDRGLCGPYNGSVIRMSLKHIRTMGDDARVEVSGRKGASTLKFNGVKVADQHTIFGDKPKYEDIEILAQKYMDLFVSGEVASVSIAYTRFISTSRQSAEVLPLLPLKPPTVEGDVNAEAGTTVDYEFTPSAEELLAEILPLTVKTTLLQCFNDAVVSEHVARMIAMKAATDNAGKMGTALTRKYNRARQAQITTELTEIISGAAALE